MITNSLFTIGYGKWTTAKRMEKLIEALTLAKVDTLVDIRHAPCSSQISPNNNKTYLPKDWHLQTGAGGIITALSQVGIEYIWLVELGNPQKNDPDMCVMREHINSKKAVWPVNRGLRILQDIVADETRTCCLLCACGSYDDCHRKLIAESLVSGIQTNSCHIEDLSK